MKALYSIIILVIVIVSCSSSEEVDFTLRLPNSGIVLSDLEVGQSVHYLRYESDCNQSNFQLTGDTLIAEVIEENGILYLRESFTAGSLIEAEASLTKVEVHDGYILITDRFQSPLLYFYGNDSLFFNKPIESILRQSDCKLEIESEPFIGDEVGQLDEFSFGKIHIEDKMGVSCIPLIFELDGFLIYDDKFLYLSHTVTDNNNVNGFIAVEL